MDHTPFGQGAVDYPTLMRRSLSLLSQISAKRWASRLEFPYSRDLRWVE